MGLRRRLGLVLVVVSAVACGDGSGTPDGGADIDAGLDATVPTDGMARPDGTLLDGGAPDGRDRDAFMPPMAAVHLIGRFEGDVTDARAAWPGSAIATRFDGTTLSADLEDGGGNWLDVVVDGEMHAVIETTGGRQTYMLASGLAAGMHDLVLTKRTESFAGVLRFRGFSGSPLVETPEPTRFIEVVGDSISCGYGVLGVGPGCPFSADTEAETHAWGAFAATDLGAAHATIAYSGRGMIRNYGGDTSDPMPVLFERTFADLPDSVWAFDGYVPDVVVINLGTNDFSIGDPGGDFVDGYAAFIGQLRSHYPDAWIVMTTSPMLGGADHDQHRTYLEEVATRVGDPRVSTLDLAVQDAADGYGCDWHPSEATQRKMADALVSRIRELTGW